MIHIFLEIYIIVTKSDVRNALRKIRIGKSIKPDDIPIEVWE